MRRHAPLRLAAGALALAMAAAACTADGMTRTEEAAAARAAAGAHLVSDSIRPELTPVDQLEPTPEGEVNATYAPEVPPPATRSSQRTWSVELEAIEGICPLDPGNGVDTETWGYRLAGDDEVVCGAPGPVLRGRVGDLVTISMSNSPQSTNPHNIDFHAVTGQGGGAADLVANPGETATIQVRLLYPGAFMYHCAYGDVPSHIAHGMYGMFIVDPESPLHEVDHEWAIMQSEWYVGEPDSDGIAPFDRDALLDEEPSHVTFNGRTDALVGDNTLAMRTGQRARIYFVNEGLNLDSNFHPIGSHWDAVWPEGATHAANRVIRGSQSTLVVAGGGTVVELDALVPSTLILVDHALVRTFYKGAIGTIVVEGDTDPSIFLSLNEEAAPPEEPGTDDGDGTTVTASVSIPDGAFDPANADTAYDPLALEVTVGTTVTWTNDDTVAHTVTSGPSDGTRGEADGLFDSGFLDAGDSFSYTFTEVGEFPYYCLPHPWMVGSVTVTE